MNEFIPKVWSYGLVTQISRELLLDYGMARRTPAEQAKHDAQMAEWRAERKAAQPGIRRALAALDALDGLAREVLDLHAREGRYPQCHGCDAGSYAEDYPGWPCRTVQLIAEHHGIDLSNVDLYDPEDA